MSDVEFKLKNVELIEEKKKNLHGGSKIKKFRSCLACFIRVFIIFRAISTNQNKQHDSNKCHLVSLIIYSCRYSYP